MTKITSIGYNVILGNTVDALNEYFASHKHNKVVIIADENTSQHCWSKIAGKVEALNNAEIIELESGEINKNLEICGHVWSTLMEIKFSRNDLVINLGGGVVTDLGGFVASTFKRGVNFIQIPTTVLAMVDAAVGGKVGVDFNGLKNIIGNFATPKAVIVDTDFLETIPPNQLRSGFAEVLKHGLIADKKYWDKARNITEFSVSEVSELIERSVQIKNEIVLGDFKDTGERKKLNFGHTIGHAIESYFLNTSTPMLHGDAVALGMLSESFLSVKHAGLPEKELDQLCVGIKKWFSIPNVSEDQFQSLLELMKNDKKNSGDSDSINFTLLNSIGKSTIDYNLSSAEVSPALHWLFKR